MGPATRLRLLALVVGIAVVTSACASAVPSASPTASAHVDPTAQEVSMNEQSSPTPSGARLEASTEVAVIGGRVRVSCRALQPESLAGGPLEVEVVIENLGGDARFLAVGTDRARLRPAYFGFVTSLVGSNLDLSDPHEAVPDLGGPRTSVKIEPAGSYRQTVLVNDFVSLEKVRDALPPGGAGTLQVRCQRALTVGTTAPEALTVGPKTPTVDVTINVPVHRDDQALANLIADLAAKVNADRGTAASAEREEAIAQLVSLRQSDVIPYLESLRDHPDPAVQMRVKQALATTPGPSAAGNKAP